MPGKARPSLKAKTLLNVDRSNLSITDKKCIHHVFEKFEEVKHGHWIKRGNEKKCSVCAFVYYSNNDEWNGCPNCLAKMDDKV